MRTITKILFSVALLVMGARMQTCYQSWQYAIPTVAAMQPQPRYPLPQYAPGLESSVFVELGNTHCTGVLSGDNYHIVTATHCMDGNKVTAITSYRGGRIETSGKIIANDGRDHVRIKLKHPIPGRPAKIAPMPPPGSEIYVVGNPSEFRFLLRVGRVTGQYVSDEGELFDTLDISMWHGDSGGAIFDSAGNIVGLCYGYSGDYNPFSHQGWMVQLSQPFAFQPGQLK